jgi:hypothetical protein
MGGFALTSSGLPMLCPNPHQVSGTDASKSRYREFSSGILDALQRERLMMRLEPLGLELRTADVNRRWIKGTEMTWFYKFIIF